MSPEFPVVRSQANDPWLVTNMSRLFTSIRVVLSMVFVALRSLPRGTGGAPDAFAAAAASDTHRVRIRVAAPSQRRNRIVLALLSLIAFRSTDTIGFRAA